MRRKLRTGGEAGRRRRLWGGGGQLGLWSIFPRHAHPGAERIACLLERNWLGQYEARAEAECIGYARFSFYDRDGDGTFVLSGSARTVEDLGRGLHIVAIHNEHFETLPAEALESERGVTGMLETDLKFIEDLGNGVDRLLVAGQQEYTGGHDVSMLWRQSPWGKLP